MFPNSQRTYAKWILLALTFVLSKSVAAQMVLYDNFNSPQIDPAKWIGVGSDPDIRDEVRALSGEERNRHLRLSQTAYSATTDDNGTSGNVFGLGFPDPNAVNEVSFDLVVNKAEAVGCTSNPSGQIVTAAELRGRFFNTEAVPASQLGDVETAIGAARNASDSTPALEVDGFYQRCDDDFCGARTTLAFERLGFIQPGSTNRLHIRWDQPNHRFIFQLNNEPLVLSPYTVSDTSAPFFGRFENIDLARVVPHCTTTPRPFASIDASFDNVRVSQ
jgi:hypothetical protein